MIETLRRLPRLRAWWFGLVVFGLFLECTALYYQYALDFLPCVLCIHVRLLVAVAMVVWLLTGIAAGHGWARLTGLAASVALAVALTERSYGLLATENGWIAGSCEMDSGLPSWAAVDRWLPWLFEIHEPCGYTPYIVANVSMAEVLMVMSVTLTLLFSALLVATATARGHASVE